MRVAVGATNNIDTFWRFVMNCYTVVNGQIQIGIALNKKSDDASLSLVLGEKTGQAGNVKEVFLSPNTPASHVLVGGGVNLMRTAKVLKNGDGENAIFLFGRAKNGLRIDATDNRALVLVEYVASHHPTPGYIPKSYQDIPVYGFKVLQSSPRTEDRLYKIQALVVLQLSECFRFYDKPSEVGRTISYKFDPKLDRYPMLECLPTREYRMRDEKKLVAI